MVEVSQAWKDIQQRLILPESFVEIDFHLNVTDGVSVSNGSSQIEEISDVNSVLDNTKNLVQYATTELNFWSLDGSKTIAPSGGPYSDTGYISTDDNVILYFEWEEATPLSCLTINFGECYPSQFEVLVHENGVGIVEEITISDNNSRSIVVPLSGANCTDITITTRSGGIGFPNRRARVESVGLGKVTLTKDDIISYTHEQSGHLNSGGLPKNSITFTVDNTTDRWSPFTQDGLGKYLSERQEITVRYGLDVGDTVEWIKAGKFYLSEWNIPSNGLTASFMAKDSISVNFGKQYTDTNRGLIKNHIQSTFTTSDIPFSINTFFWDDTELGYDSIGERIDWYIDNEEIVAPSGHTCAEILLMCANAAGRVLFQDRDGIIRAKHLNVSEKNENGYIQFHQDYVIGRDLSYSHPEIESTKVVSSVAVKTSESSSPTWSYSGLGGTQTVENHMIGSYEHAKEIADWVHLALQNTKIVSGEYRADPRLDVFDKVTVQSKYGEMMNVVITDIKYTFNGSFKGSYTGRVLGESGT